MLDVIDQYGWMNEFLALKPGDINDILSFYNEKIEMMTEAETATASEEESEEPQVPSPVPAPVPIVDSSDSGSISEEVEVEEDELPPAPDRQRLYRKRIKKLIPQQPTITIKVKPMIKKRPRPVSEAEPSDQEGQVSDVPTEALTQEEQDVQDVQDVQEQEEEQIVQEQDVQEQEEEQIVQEQDVQEQEEQIVQAVQDVQEQEEEQMAQDVQEQEQEQEEQMAQDVQQAEATHQDLEITEIKVQSALASLTHQGVAGMLRAAYDKDKTLGENIIVLVEYLQEKPFDDEGLNDIQQDGYDALVQLYNIDDDDVEEAISKVKHQGVATMLRNIYKEQSSSNPFLGRDITNLVTLLETHGAPKAILDTLHGAKGYADLVTYFNEVAD